MRADFLDAHRRHWDDAEHLLQEQRWANADHLYGISAECGLKRLMLKFDMPYDSVKDKPAQKQDSVHAKDIWTRFESYRSGHAQGAGYMLPANNPFDNWDISDRYAHRSNFDQARAQGHRAGAMIVCALIKKAEREGLLI